MKHAILLVLAMLLAAPAGARADGGLEHDPRHTAQGRPRDAAAARSVPSGSLAARRNALMPTVRAARPAGLPLALVDAVITQESGYRAAVRGSRGEVGLMQILPATARSIARTTGIGGVAGLSHADLVRYLSEPSNNLRVGLAYLSWCHSRANGHVGATIGCYNAGPGNMWRWNSIRVTRNYVRKVERHMAGAGS